MEEDLIETKSPTLRLLTSILRGLWKSDIKNCEFGNEESSFVSAKQITFTLPATYSQSFSILFRVEFMCKSEEIKLPTIFDLKLRKWDTLENETIKLFARTSPLLFLFMSQTEFTILEKVLINKEVQLLFKCNFVLLKQVVSMLLFFIKIIPLP